MSPTLGPFPAFAIGWALAAVLGGLCLWWILGRADLRPANIIAVWALACLWIVLGSKALFFVEVWASGRLVRQGFIATLLSPQMRIPGGMLLAVLLIPLAPKLLELPALWLGDLAIPAAAVCLVGIRIGCFLQGCCFGEVCSLPWAVRFPRFTAVFAWQVNRGLVPVAAASSLPVHPLQLYFALCALVIAIGLIAIQRRKRYEGQVVLVFLLSYLWSTWLLEHLRARPHELTRAVVLAAALAATLAGLVLELRTRAVLRRV